MPPASAEGVVGRRVVIYCPDRHIAYDARTPARSGVGGGITARVRMARALARLGHQVTMAVHCREAEVLDGVRYLPLDGLTRLSGDIVVLTTSGGGLDLRPAASLPIEARLRLVWVHGPDQPLGLAGVEADVIYAVSNDLADTVRLEWGVPGGRLFVAYNGFEAAAFEHAERRRPERDPHRLVYFSHPSKGLQAALSVLRRLRAGDPRFHLLVFGGAALWGQTPAAPLEADGVVDRGLVGQEMLAAELLGCAFSLQLQRRREPGALAIPEAMRGGSVIVASPVGCYPEMVHDGVDGLLVPGDPHDEATQAAAAERILSLSAEPPALEAVRRRARAAACDTDTLAQAWSEDWDWRLEGRPPAGGLSTCPACAGPSLLLADGAHCIRCGRTAGPRPAESRTAAVRGPGAS